MCGRRMSMKQYMCTLGGIYIVTFQWEAVSIISFVPPAFGLPGESWKDLFTLDDIYSFYFLTHNPPGKDLMACGKLYTLLDSLSASSQALLFEF